jgi:hypothetical protein
VILYIINMDVVVAYFAWGATLRFKGQSYKPGPTLN